MIFPHLNRTFDLDGITRVPEAVPLPVCISRDGLAEPGGVKISGSQLAMQRGGVL